MAAKNLGSSLEECPTGQGRFRGAATGVAKLDALCRQRLSSLNTEATEDLSDLCVKT